jgi:hypothetical protein
MPDYKFGNDLFTESDVQKRAQEKSLTLEEYLAQNPEILKVDEGKQNDTATTGTAPVSDTVSNSEKSLSASQSVKKKSPRTGVRKNSDGSHSTHLMRREKVDGKWVVFPSLFQEEDSSWKDMSKEDGWYKIHQEAKKRGEVYEFDSEEDATNFADKGSWKKGFFQEDDALQAPVAPIANRTDWLTKDLFNQQEEEAIGQLKQKYPEFKFSETGKFFPFDEVTKKDPRRKQRLGLANFIEVEADNGNKLLLETALSSSSQSVVNKKGGKKFLDQYYEDQIGDLTKFIKANQVKEDGSFIVSEQELYKRKQQRRSVFLAFDDGTKLLPEELEKINNDFSDTSIFDIKSDESFINYIPTRERVPGLPEQRNIKIQPYEDILKQAKSKINEEFGDNFNNSESIKKAALVILKENAIEELRKEKTKQYLEEIESGEIPDVLEEDFARFIKEGEKISVKDIKPYITIGAKEYDADLTSFMLGTVSARNKVEDLQDRLQDIVNKKVYTEEDIVQYGEVYKKYESSFSDYNDTVEALSRFAVDIKHKPAQLNLLQKNYNDWDKQGIGLILNFRDFAAKAVYGVSSFVGADGNLPDKDDPTRTREEVRTQDLVNTLNQSQIIRSGYGDDVSFDNAFKNPANFAKWTVSMGNSQLPILASLATPGGWFGLLQSSFGENYKEMTYEEMKTKAAAEELGFDYSTPEYFEKNSKFNKWVFSTMFSLPEVYLDRITTGMRIRGVKEMFTGPGRDQLISKNLKEVISDLAYGLPQDAVLGATSEGTTQLWQNFLTGKEDIWEGVSEAAFSGLLMDGVLSSMPTLKAAVYTQLTDPEKIKSIQAAQKKLDTLITIRDNTPKLKDGSAGTLDEQIKELRETIETQVREAVDPIIGIGGRGLTTSAMQEYIQLIQYKASLKNQAESVINDDLTLEKDKQELLKELYAKYEGIKAIQKAFESEKGSEFSMWASNPKNKAMLDVYVRQAKNDLNKKEKKYYSDLEIQDRAKVLYNTDKILKEEAGVKKLLRDEETKIKIENRRRARDGKEKKSTDLLDKSITYVKTEKEFNEWIDKVVQTKIDALKANTTDRDFLINLKQIRELESSKKAYKEGSYGFNVDGNSVAIVENMAKDDRLQTRTHELGHEIGSRAFGVDQSIYSGMAKTILDWAKVNDEGLFNRLQRITERDKNKKLKDDEVMAVFFEEVAADRVKLKSEKNKGLLSIFGFGTNKALKDKYNIDIDLAGVDDTFEFVYGLAKKISKSAITPKQIKELSKSKAAKALIDIGNKKNKNIVNKYLADTENVVKKSAKSGIFEKGKKIDKLPDSYNLEQWEKGGADAIIVEMYDDLTGLILSKGAALKNLPNFSQEDYVNEVLVGMMKVIRSFNPWQKNFKKGINPIFQALVDQGVEESDISKMTWGEIKNKVGPEVIGSYGFSGWVNSQLMYKIYDAQRSGRITTDTYSVDESADNFKEIVATEDDLELFEDEDLSLEAQLRKKQKEKRRAERGMEVGVEYSKFRRELELNGNKGISDAIKNQIQSITLEILASPKYIDLDLNAISETLRRDLELALHKAIKNAMGVESDYVDFLTRNKNTILRHMDVSSLVTFERIVNTKDRVMTKFVRRLQTKKDVQDAIDNGWLSHVDNPAQGPGLYKVLQPSIGDYLKFYLPPIKIESGKKVRQWNIMSDTEKQQFADGVNLNLEQARKSFVEVRSMNKGERKKSLSEKIGGQLAFDATMEIIQGDKFASLRAMRGKPVLAQARINEVARRIDRGIDVKFSKKSVSQFAASMASDLIDLAVKQKTSTPNIKLLDKAKYKIYDNDSKQLANDLADSILKLTTLETKRMINKQISNRPKGIKYSKKTKSTKPMSQTINDMIERKAGIPSDKVFSKTLGSIKGREKNKVLSMFKQVYLPPSAEDFLGLAYQIIGRGDQGNADLEFFKENLVVPFSEAYTKLDTIRQVILNDVNELNKSYPEVKNKLKDKMFGTEYTYEDAIRVYLFDKNGFETPGISTEEQANLVGRVETDIELAIYAEGLNQLSRSDKWVKPSDYWAAGSIAADINKIVEGTHRKDLLETWIENKNEIFSEDNMNKLEAAYGKDYRDALDNMLNRMQTGISKSNSGDNNKINNQFTNWLNNSIGTVMFFNVKSAMLQTLSTVNYLNFEDNNIFAAGKAFADINQFLEDWTMIYNSDFLKNRRSGIRTDVSLAEISDNVANATEKSRAIIAFLLKKGFAPTQIADSFAIASGGATFYRNRLNKYIKEGKTQKEAENQAFIDFREVTEETQQSARPDRVSQQQTSDAGRLILAFQNAPMQFNRIIKKSALDLINGRGDYRANISNIIYYGGIQSFVFAAMQNALFALTFDEDDEDVRGVTILNMDDKLKAKELEKRKKFELNKIERIVNGMGDTILRGSGITGAIIATIKNASIKFYKEAQKGKRMDIASVLIETTQMSPQVGSKVRKIAKGLRSYKWDSEAIPLMSKFDPQNPMYTFGTNITEAVTNVPIARIINKVNNLRRVTESQHEAWQRVGMLLGWSAWDLGVDPSLRIKQVIKEGKEKGLIKSKGTAKICLATKSDGTPCRNTTKNKNQRCYLHD